MQNSKMAEEEDFDWDADDFDPEAGFTKKDDRWEGEDEGLVIQQEAPKPEETKAKPAKEKKPKVDRIEEKKAQRREAEKKEEVAERREMTAEEKLAEKLRLQQIQKDADLEVAKELFGVTGNSSSIDAMQPSTEEDFHQFVEALSKKIAQFETSIHFVPFMGELIRRTCASLDVGDMRKLSTTLSTMATEKQKTTMPHKTKKKTKASLGGGKASKRADVDALDYDNDLGAEYDDFM